MKQKIFTNMGEVSVVGTRLTTVDLIDRLSILQSKNIPSFSKVAQELCCEQWNKYIGAEKVLRVVTDPQNSFLDQPGLEFEKYFGGTDTRRIYDIVYEYGNGLYKFIEVKSWSDFNATTFKTQFKKDLQNIESLDQLEWIFDAKRTFTLKEEVINAMRNDKASFELIGVEKVKKILDDKGIDVANIDENNFVEILIQSLEKDEIFNTVFKVQ